MPAWVNVVLALLANPQVEALLNAVIAAIVAAINSQPPATQAQIYKHIGESATAYLIKASTPAA